MKTWRNLHLSKLCNLTTAAKVLGISKKSLDDYFLILRIAEELNYDFETNLKNKMGHLRAFIKGSDRKVTGKLHK